MKRFLLSFLVLLSIQIVSAQTNISGTITTDSTLTLAGSPYTLTGNLTVADGVTLTVNNGVQVLFNSTSRRLYIYGTLNATGATFTSNQGSPDAGDWSTIYIGNGSTPSTSTFTSCQISYGSSIEIANLSTLNLNGTDVSDMTNYGLYISTGGTVNVTNVSTISNCQYGAYVLGGDLTLNNSDILNCSNTGIYLTNQLATVSLTDVEITNCDWPIKFTQEASLTLAGTNNFTGNTHDGMYMQLTTIDATLNLPYVDIPWYFYYTGNITITNSGAVIVAENNILKFDGTILVDGQFTANAGVGQNIFITSVKDDNWGGDTNDDGNSTSPSVSDWGGIRFRDASNDGANILRRCQIRYGGQSNQYGAVDCENASPTIDLCEFQSNYFGASFRGSSDPIFTNNTIGSSTQTPVAMTFDANPTFTNNSFSFSDNNYDAIGLLGSTLTRNATLIKRDVTAIPNVTYVLLGNVTVPVGDTLTIVPGIVIKPLSSTQLIIEGALIANGTMSEKIVFTSIKDDNFGNPMDTNKDGTISVPNKRDWRGIYFDSGSEGLINYGIVKYADYYYLNVHFYQYLGAIHINDASPTISNTEIKDVDYGIACLNTATPVLSNNEITNTTFTPVALSASADPIFSGNTFTNNGLTALGIVGERITSSGTIKNRDVAGFNSITYVLLSDLYIHTGSNVAVDSGVVIKMQPGAGIIVGGGFRVNGDAANKTYFTSVKDDNLGNPFDTNGDGNATAPTANDWDNIMYIGAADDSYNVIDNAVISYSGNGSYSWQLVQPCCTSYNSQGSISFENAGGIVQNTIIDNSYYYGLETDGNSDPSFNNVIIQNCRLDPIAISLLSDPNFNNITFTANGSKGIRILEGTLSSNAQLKQRSIAGIPNVAYIVSSLTISSNSVLTVDPGVVIKFDNAGSRITVNGGLKLLGTSPDKIILTSINDDSAGGDTNNDGNSSVPSPGNWDAVIYNATSTDTANILQYCELRYAGYSFGNDASMVINSAYVLVDNVTFQQANQWGIRITGNANPDIQNSSFLNIGDAPIWMSMFAEPTFTNNTALNVDYMAIGIITETWSQTATIPKRNFAGNNNITYLLDGNITINTGTTITIPDGISFKRVGSQRFTVNGRLNVEGTGGSPVSFTDYRDDSYGVPLDMNQDGSATSPNSFNYNWFIFNDVSNDSSEIDNAIMAYADEAIDCNSASPKVRNSLFENCRYGLRLDGVSNPELTDNTFNDLTYTPFQTSLVSYPAVTSGNSITGSTYSCIGVINETLVQDVTLGKKDFGGVTNIPYLFGTYTIGSGATLTFEPGVVNKFFNSGRITVNKGLIAEGGATADSNIVFTHIEDDFYGGDNNADGDATTPSTSDWNGIWYQNEALDPLSRIDHCVFRYAGSNTTYGAVTANSASPSIKNTLFNKCETALVATGAANPTINYCDFNELDNYGVYNRDQSFVINAENNWWGSNTGPTHSGNPGGTGEPVTDAVDYDPWSTIVENPLMGDISLNGIVQAFDASLALQHVIAPFLNPDQLIVADVSGASGITAFDASLILQFVVGLIDVFPAETVRIEESFEVSNVALSIGNTSAFAGDEITLPLSISNVSGVLGMDILINYDYSLLTLTNVEIQNTDMNSLVDYSESGKLKIAMAGTASLEEDEVLGWLTFKIADNVNQTNIPIKIQSFLANENELRRFSINGDVTVEGLVTGIQNNATGLLPIYPNPAKDVIHIEYQIQNSTDRVRLSVYDAIGHEIAVLVDDVNTIGKHTIKWNINDAHSQLQSGYYFIRLSVGETNETRKVLLLN